MADVAETVAALTRLQGRLDDAMVAIVSEVLERVQTQARANTSDFHYDYPEAKPPGELAASIIKEGPIGGGGVYQGAVGPTVVYGAQREFGGHIFAHGGGLMKFAYRGSMWYTPHVYQQEYQSGRYLSPAGRKVGNQYARGIAEYYLTEAINGG